MIDYECFCKIRDHLDRQGLTRAQTARALGLHARTAAKWSKLTQYRQRETPARSTKAKTAVIYILADGELHLLALTAAEPEIRELLADARKSGHLLVLWVTSTGDRRLSLIQFDESLAGMLKGTEHEVTSDFLSPMYDLVRAVQYALSSDKLRQVGIDPGTVRRQVVHYLATPSMLDLVNRLAGQWH